MNLLTPDALAEILGVSTSTLAKWRLSGCPTIPFIKLGRSVRYPQDAVQQFIQSRELHRSTVTSVRNGERAGLTAQGNASLVEVK
jgi:excisionase family DNA binding protein